jgi:hypothetical protein
MSILNYTGLFGPLEDIYYGSRTGSFEASIPLARHDIIHSFWRSDKLKASIFELAAVVLVS